VAGTEGRRRGGVREKNRERYEGVERDEEEGDREASSKTKEERRRENTKAGRRWREGDSRGI
jgi:hypothetical protein